MNKLIIATFLILNVAFSNAVFLKKPNKSTFNIFNQLKDVEKMNFGKKILDTIALQLSNKSPLGDIAKMLAEIRQDLVTQQAEADQLHAAQEQECAEEIAEYEKRIAEGIREKEDAEQEIALLKADIARLEGEILNKGKQLEILDIRETEMTAARERDEEEFEKRQKQSVEVVGALELIIEKLGTIEANTNDEKMVMAELSKIGSSNPILALVQVASTFSQESLDHVIGKMDELMKSLEASIEQDKIDEKSAKDEYAALMGELTKTRKDVAAAKAEAEAKLTQAKGALALQERILKEAVQQIKDNQEAKAAKKKQCEEWRAKYEVDKEARTKEIEIVKQVEAIIATKLETMKDYLKERANEGV